jgi:hypothetical protein
MTFFFSYREGLIINIDLAATGVPRYVVNFAAFVKERTMKAAINKFFNIVSLPTNKAIISYYTGKVKEKATLFKSFSPTKSTTYKKNQGKA